eukprot:336834_1
MIPNIIIIIYSCKKKTSPKLYTMPLVDDGFTHTSKYIVIDRTLSLILELIMIVIVTVYGVDVIKFARKMFKKKKKRVSSRDILTRSSLKYRKACHLFSLLTLFIYSIQGGNYVLNAFSLYPLNASCNAIKIFSVMTYHLGKCCLYVVLVIRVKIAFASSSFMDNNCVKYTLYTIYFLTFSFFIIIVFGDAFTITGSLVFAKDNKKMYYCLLDDMPTWGFLVFLGLDLIISILCVSVFNYPLKVMMKQHSDGKIIELIRKYAVLATTAICSTFFLILLVNQLKLGWLSLLDNIINSTCLLFMSSWYQKYWDVVYKKLCCCCNKKLIRPKHLNRTGSGNEEEPTTTHLSTTTALTQTPRPAMSPSPKSDGRSMMSFPVTDNPSSQNDNDNGVLNVPSSD